MYPSGIKNIYIRHQSTIEYAPEFEGQGFVALMYFH